MVEIASIEKRPKLGDYSIFVSSSIWIVTTLLLLLLAGACWSECTARGVWTSKRFNFMPLQAASATVIWTS